MEIMSNELLVVSYRDALKSESDKESGKDFKSKNFQKRSETV